MLGLANTISSGSSALESLYSITLDGTDDYVSIDSLTSELSDDMAYSLSIWFKGDSNDISGGGNIFFSAHAAGSANIIRIGVDLAGTKGIFYSDSGTSDTTNLGDVDLDDGAWHNIIITRPSGSGGQQSKLYIDGGSAITTDLDDSDPQWSSATRVSIGQEWDGASATDHYQGEIDEVAFWNVELDDASRAKVYNSGKPFNLTFDSGHYDNSSALVAYYRMGNGLFDDKANGVIHDQHNPGFGAEALTNGDFETDGDITADSWSLGWAGLSDSGAAEGVTIEDGLLVIHNDGTANDGRVYATNGSSSQNVVTSGKIYKLTYTIVEILGESVAMKYHTGAATVDLTNEQETVGTHTIYYRAAGTVFILYQLTSGSTVKLSEVSLKPLNGFPGLTSGGPTFISDTP